MSFEMILLLALGLGLLHALDPDHVMAVSTLSNEKPGVRRAVGFSMHWALGHGGILIASGVMLFGLGVAIPQSLQHMAELGVGVLLVLLGAACFWQLHQNSDKKVTVAGFDVPLVSPEKNVLHEKQKTEQATIKPIAVGILHGLAGSAPALALIPAASKGQLTLALSYLVLFSLGVMLSMMCFGLSFAYSQQLLAQRYYKVFYWSRYAVAICAIFMGVYWLTNG